MDDHIKTINMDHINDALSQGSIDVVSDIVDLAKKATKAGHMVIVQYEFTNANPSVIMEFTTSKEVEDWHKSLLPDSSGKGVS